MTDMREEIAQLKDVLVQERALLRTGRGREAVDLMEFKLSAIERLEHAFGTFDVSDIPLRYREEMADIATLARENGIHFDAVRNGTRRAIQRLESMHDEAFVGSYTQTGSKVTFTAVTGRLLKKA